MKKYLLFLSFCIGILSCSDEDVNDLTSQERIVEEKTVPLISSYEELYKTLNLVETVVATERKETKGIVRRNDIEPSFAKGYTRKSIYNDNQKVMFDPTFAESLGGGVAPYTVYFVRVDKCEMDIYTGGKSFFDNVSDQCGAVPSPFDSDGLNFKIVGYSIVKLGNPTVLETYLLYISGGFGNAARGFFPRNPEALIWSYFLF